MATYISSRAQFAVGEYMDMPSALPRRAHREGASEIVAVLLVGEASVRIVMWQQFNNWT